MTVLVTCLLFRVMENYGSTNIRSKVFYQHNLYWHPNRKKLLKYTLMGHHLNSFNSLLAKGQGGCICKEWFAYSEEIYCLSARIMHRSRDFESWLLKMTALNNSYLPSLFKHKNLNKWPIWIHRPWKYTDWPRGHFYILFRHPLKQARNLCGHSLLIKICNILTTIETFPI